MTHSLSERSKKLAEEAKKLREKNGDSGVDYGKLTVDGLNAADHGENLDTA